ncbi:MAG: META domain-containing protein, partial [Anaerolineae bacterium]|nr:META domain-containing protein [Anaerolineae bacterium]
MKTIAYILILMAMVVTIASCGGATATLAPTPEPTPEPPPTEAPPEPAEAESAGDVTSYPWLWTSFTSPVEQFDVEAPENYVVTFNDDGTVNIKADCNNASGSYTVAGSNLTIEVGPMTKAACPPESRSDQFVKYLGFAARYFFEDAQL